MPLITLQNLQLSFGGDPLLDDLSLQLDTGQRICLLGRNGTGKTSLLKIISGELRPDSGTIDRLPDLRVARLPQAVPDNLSGSVFDVVAQTWDSVLVDYHHAAVRASAENTPTALHDLADAQHRLEAVDGWALHHRIEALLTQMELDAEAEIQSLSGGIKRRVLLARALVGNPDILLLDEPTNHLDIDSIRWLESVLQSFQGTVFLVTHDRAFMRAVANRILELDRGRLFDWACDYDTFLKRKQQLLDDTVKQEQRFDRLLSQEEAWIRKGIKARRTRNEGRVRRLQEMRAQRRARRTAKGQVKLQLSAAKRSGDLVAEAEDVSFAYGATPIITGLTTVIERGDRVGIIGPNGCGKTTLLKLLLGQLPPQTGNIRLGTKLDIAYFDQLRATLRADDRVFDSINNGNDKVNINGHWRSVYSYLEDFLFTPDQARSPLSVLSGGERNRLLLAKLFVQSPNLLVMDEPTNDLDIETLELLEEKLMDFDGTLLLVSHDREFINNVVTCTLVFEDDTVKEYPGGYDDWLAQRPKQDTPATATPDQSRPKPAERRQSSRKRRLSYKETRELEGLPSKIEELEAEQIEIAARLSDPASYKGDGSEISELKDRLQTVETDLATAYKRWEKLEAVAEQE